MTRKRFPNENALNILRQFKLEPAAGNSVEPACRSTCISDATYYKWRKLYGGMGKSQLWELKAIENENAKYVPSIVKILTAE